MVGQTVPNATTATVVWLGQRQRKSILPPRAQRVRQEEHQKEKKIRPAVLVKLENTKTRQVHVQSVQTVGHNQIKQKPSVYNAVRNHHQILKLQTLSKVRQQTRLEAHHAHCVTLELMDRWLNQANVKNVLLVNMKMVKAGWRMHWAPANSVL